MGMIIVFTLVDYILPHPDSIFEGNSGPWIVATAMILCYVILNTLVSLRIEPILPYLILSVVLYFAILGFSYLWCNFLTGKHIDDVGSIRWLWFVLTLVYMIFFAIARSMKRIIDIANDQDAKLRGE